MEREDSHQIAEIVSECLSKIGVKVPLKGGKIDTDFIRSDTFFISIFKKIMSKSPGQFNEENFLAQTAEYSTGKRIQALIDKLGSDEFLGIDLGHISGFEIAKGNQQHIKLFFKLLSCLSVPSNDDSGKDENALTNSKNETDSEAAYRQSNSFLNSSDKDINDIEREMQENAGFPLNYDPHYQVEDQEYLKPTKFAREYTYKKASGGGYKKGRKKKKKKRQTGMKGSIIQTIERNLYGPVFVNTKKRLKKSKLTKNLMPKLSAGQRRDIMNQLELEEEMDQNTEIDEYEILLKKNLSAKDKQLEEILSKQKRKYMYSLHEYMGFLSAQEQRRSKKREKAKARNLQDKMRSMAIYHKKVKEDLRNEQLSMQYKMRDDQANYMRTIKKVIFKLEKQKIIDEKKNRKKNRESKVKNTHVIMHSIENFYKDKICMLKERLAKERIERKKADLAQRKMLTAMERELKQNNKNKMKNMVQSWKQEKGKFSTIMRNQSEMENEFVKLFQKYQLN